MNKEEIQAVIKEIKEGQLYKDSEKAFYEEVKDLGLREFAIQAPSKEEFYRASSVVVSFCSIELLLVVLGQLYDLSTSDVGQKGLVMIEGILLACLYYGYLKGKEDK